MSFTVPELRYSFDALEPYIDAETMRIHHDKHHAAYVANLNKAIEGTEYAAWSLETLVRDWDKLPVAIKTAVRNNGGGHWNHSFFWESIAPNAGGKPAGALAAAIEKELGGFDAFKTEFGKAAMGRFGSGWAWLSFDGKSRKLVIGSTPNQDSPITEGLVPLLGVDVWEHAYYLKYQNRRADYLEAFFSVIDWKKVGERFERAAG
ncbi:MAG: superoxide dismutase [Rectinemataceae bacterium]|nr:superoxide dismutase [Rectinemataceae bacterium]